jgi:hypothetical protein
MGYFLGLFMIVLVEGDSGDLSVGIRLRDIDTSSIKKTSLPTNNNSINFM